MKILVFGASGRTGHELVRQGLAQGHEVTAFVRDIDKLKFEDENLRVMQGDVGNYPLVEKAIEGHDAVLSALGAPNPFKYDQTVVDGTGNVIKAMETAHVGRFIYMSAINVRESRPNAGPVIRLFGPTLLRHETRGHEEREKLIRRSKLEWTIVRSGKLSNGDHKALYRFGEDVRATGPAATISRADVADFMLRQLIDKTFVRKFPIVMY
jgi:putative NADH-flavin reductase